MKVGWNERLEDGRSPVDMPPGMLVRPSVPEQGVAGETYSEKYRPPHPSFGKDQISLPVPITPSEAVLESQEVPTLMV